MTREWFLAIGEKIGKEAHDTPGMHAYFSEFQPGEASWKRRMARGVSRFGTRLLPRFGTNVYLVGTK